jgi:hypothetical protein
MNVSLPSYSDDSCWGWLKPAPECVALPYVMLRGTTIGIGRGADAFDLAMRQQVPEKILHGANNNSNGGGEISNLNHALPQVPGLFVEIPDGRVSRVHCLLSLPGSPSSSTIPTLRDISRNGTFLNGKKLSRGEEAVLADGDRISLVLSVAPLSEQAFIFHLGHPLAALLEGPPPTQWIGWKGNSLSSERDRTRVNALSERSSEGVMSSRTSSASLGSPSPKSFPPQPPSPSPVACGTSPPSSSSCHLPRASSYKTAMKRSATSLYTTPEAALEEPSTLQCQICLETLRNAVALVPCGHSYCATCLSHHLGSSLNSSLQQALACPLRCSQPQSVVANTAVRQLVEELSKMEEEKNNGGEGGQEEEGVEEQREGDVDNEIETQIPRPTSAPFFSEMHESAPLDNAHLPLTLSSLKEDKIVNLLKTVSHAGALLTDISSSSSNGVATSPDSATFGLTTAASVLDVIARLCWSDEQFRGLVSSHNGVEIIAQCVDTWVNSEVAVCSGCLALMALIRGDGPASSANRWQLGVCGGLEILIKAMKIHKDQSMVQLSVLLCLVPMALEASYFRQEISKIGIKAIVSAIKRHIDCEEVVAKALLAAGALAQGGGREAELVVERLVAAGVVELIALVLKRYGGVSEDVLWASLFVLAVLARKNEVNNASDGDDEVAAASENNNRGHVERIIRMASAGILAPLRTAVAEYRLNYNVTTPAANYNESNGGGVGVGSGDQTGQEEEMIIVAADFLDEALTRAHAVVYLRRVRRVTQAACAGVLLWMGYKTFSRSRNGNSSTKSSTSGTISTRNIVSVPRRHFPWFSFKL